jgi:hypothetical protein
MTSCRRAREALAESWGTGLPLDSSVRRHVEGCRPCAELASGLPEILDLVRRVNDHDPGQAYWDGFLARVRGRVERERGPRRSSRLPIAPHVIRRWVTASAAAAAALLIVVLLLEPGRPGKPPVPEPEIALLRARLESRLLAAEDEARRAAVDDISPATADPDLEGVGEAWPAARGVEDEESAEEALGAATSILSPAPREGLPDPAGLVEDLTASQVRQWLKEIGPVERRRSAGRSEVNAG